MRRLLPLILAALLLSGCAGSSGPEPYTKEDAQALLDSGLFLGDLQSVPASVVPGLYGLDEASVQDCLSWQAADASLSADELTLLVLSDETAAQAAEEACQARVEHQLESCRTYCPDAVPRLEGAVISRVSNTVLLAVGDPDALPDAVKDLRS